MKLYTEEQLKKAIKLAQECEHECGGVYFDYTEKEIIDKLTPIELPSDDEIEKEALKREYFELSFFNGAKMVIDKIQGGNNEQ